MAFDNEKRQFSREHLWYCEIVVGGETYRFCEDITPIPRGLEVDAPSMSPPSIRPAQISITGGLGVRASASLSFKEHMDHIRFGTITSPVRFWPRWRAEHQGYQGASIAIFSGYIVNGVFDVSNFQRRDFILDSFSHNESGASISAKDVLKLANNDRAKAPRTSTGELNADILAADTSITLKPAGVGNLEYPASGLARIGDEVVTFTRVADVFTVVRGQRNTIADDHNEDDVFQLCLAYSDTVTDIINDLLVNYANVNSALIPKSEWDDEAGLQLPGLYEALITEPTGVEDLIKEINQSAPSYLFFDDRTNLIQFVAVKEPPSTAITLTAEDNLLKGSTSIIDKPELRVSTVIVNFGVFDPTKDLDEVSNYRQGHVRINLDSITKYNGIEKYKTINSRWINNANRAAAVRLAAKYGRRFQDIPRQVTFALDAKDSDVKTGTTAFINSDLVVDNTGARFNMPVEVLASGESRNYQYNALEYQYGESLPADLDSEDPNQRLVVLSGEITNINLRAIYDSLFPDLLAAYDVVFVFDSSCIVGSTSSATYAIETGVFTGLSTPPRLDVRNLIAGKGGDGADATGTAENGGTAILLNNDIRLTNNGIIGGGADVDSGTFTSQAAGGGGAGFNNGIAGTGTSTDAPNDKQAVAPPTNGTNTTGGNGGTAEVFDVGNETFATGGNGGDLGQDGLLSGGSAGKAIELNGNTITYLTTGDIRGVVS
jgi:hypothetical protein